MATKRSSFLLAVLLIANPFMLLFYQNCSVVPSSQAKNFESLPKAAKSPASEAKAQSFENIKN